MITPYGQECPYFYGDYFRGRQVEDCRLLNKAGEPKVWKSEFCENCPVPAIKQANSCPNMILSGEVLRILWKQKVKVTAYCTKTHQIVKEPKIGCGQCHPFPHNLELS